MPCLQTGFAVAIALLTATGVAYGLEGGCEVEAKGIVGAWRIETRTSDCPESPERPLLIRSSAFELEHKVVFLAEGYLSKWDHEIRLVDVETGEQEEVLFWEALPKRWVIKAFPTPESWIGRTVILEGIDPDEGGAWISMSKPLTRAEISWLTWAPRLKAGSLSLLLLSLLGLLGHRLERRGSGLPETASSR